MQDERSVTVKIKMIIGYTRFDIHIALGSDIDGNYNMKRDYNKINFAVLSLIRRA